MAGGNFDWKEHKDRQPFYNEPDPSYGGVIWANEVPKLTGANIPFIIRARVVLLRDLGSALSPFNAWAILQGNKYTLGFSLNHCTILILLTIKIQL